MERDGFSKAAADVTQFLPLFLRSMYEIFLSLLLITRRILHGACKYSEGKRVSFFSRTGCTSIKLKFILYKFVELIAYKTFVNLSAFNDVRGYV